MVNSALSLHRSSLVIDAVCPLVMRDMKYLDWYREGGVSVLSPTIGSTETAHGVLTCLAAWHRTLRERPDLILVHKASDVDEAHRSGRFGVYFHIQGTDPIEANLDWIDLYKSLGVGIVQLTYNVKNHVGDGCEERTDAGLSRFGQKLIARLNAARVIVDCSHTGLRTSMDAIECSKAPVVLSHSNVFSIHASPRNAPDVLIKAIAASGGLIGVVGFPALVSKSTAPSLDEFIAHIDALVELVGIDHVGLGIDYYLGQSGVATDEDALKGYQAAVASGVWGSAYPMPPHHYPAGIETPKTLPRLTERLLERGYSRADVIKILGANWRRVMEAVWG